MCGIAGFTHVGARGDSAALTRAIAGLRHRGPNQHGTYEDDDVSLGAVRLKIIDLGGGDQPMRTEDGEYTIVFNGEIYNHAELRRELEALGHRFESHCDTEVVLRAFAEWDTDSFPKLRGMFAAALWQRSQKRLVLVRDRLGIKPLYYSFHGRDLYFGSELKTIFEHRDLPRRINRLALGYYLSLNYVPTPWTLVEGIDKVKPGTWLEFRNGDVRTDAYWENRFAPRPRSLEEAKEELDALMRSAVREHLISDVPLGIWASGGLDSSTILHYASQVAGRKLRTFSISFAGRSFDESRYFRMLADRYGTEHHEFDMRPDLDLADTIRDMAYYSDEPSADAGALPVWFLSKMTAQNVTVALSGEGADEIFGGYHTYLADGYAATARHLPQAVLRGALSAVNRIPVSDEKIGLEYKLKRFLAGALMASDDAHFYWNGTFGTDEQPWWVREFAAESPSALVRRLQDIPDKQNVVNRYLFVDQHYYLPDDILYKCDRMSMAHSLEVRPPFLDHRIVEFAAGLPAGMKIRGRTTKYIMRELVRDKLPPQLLHRRKEGLDIPAHEWLRGPLRPLLEETLSARNLNAAGLLAADGVRALIEAHVSRRRNAGYHLWGLMVLQLWIERWNIDTQCAAGELAELAWLAAKQ